MGGRAGVSRSMSGPKLQTPVHSAALNHMVLNLALEVLIRQTSQGISVREGKSCSCTLQWQVKHGSSVAKTSLPISAAVQLLRGSKYMQGHKNVTALLGGSEITHKHSNKERNSVLTCTDGAAGVWSREQDVALGTVNQAGTLLSVTPQVLLSVRHHLYYTQVSLIQHLLLL